MKDQTVLLFNIIYPQRTGGMEVYNFHLSNNLLTNEYPNIIMLLSDPLRVDNKRVFLVRNRIFGLTRFGLGMLSVFLSCILSRHIQMRRWKTVMIPHTSDFDDNAWPVLLFSKLFGFKYIIHCHSGGDREWKSPKQQKWLFRNATHVTAVSKQIIEEYRNRTGCEIEYLPPLIKCEKTLMSKEEIKSKYNLHFHKIVLFVGSIKPLKSPETLLRAFASLPNDFVDKYDVGLVMAGEGVLRRELEDYYSSNSHVVFLGQVKNEAVKELYAIADLYVISSWFEGTPLSLMEAMYNGICCLGSDVDGVNAILKDDVNGYLFPKEDSNTLCVLMQKCIEDNRTAERIGEAASLFYQKNYCYDKHLLQVLSLLDYE